MSYFKNTTFKGIAPAVSPRLLNDQFGQTAENIEFEGGTLISIKDDINEGTTLANTSKSSIFKYKGATTQWLQWDSSYDFVHAVEGPIAADSYDRVYWTGDSTYPRYGGTADVLTSPAPYPTTSYKLGVASLTDAPATSKGGTVATDETALEVSYVYTLVTYYGEEGPPSPASATITKTSTETVTLSMPSSHAPTANRNFATGAKKRIYRSNTGSTNTTFQYLGEVGIAATSYTDSTSSSQLGEVLPSTSWIGPPDDDTSLYPDGPLQGLIAVANGVFAGFSGKRLCLSEPYLPHAWPVEYRITMEETIVALGSTNNGIVVLTEGAPYFVTGTEPAAMTAIKVNLAQSCLSKHSVVDMGEYVLYAGPDGLCAVAGAEGEVVTEGIIGVEDWRNTQRPELIKSFSYEGTYVAFWKDGSDLGGWVYDPRATDNQFSTISVSAEVRGGYSNPTDGELYLIVGDKIKKYRGGTDSKTAKWKSKKYVPEAPLSMSWLSLSAASWPTTSGNAIRVKVYGDGTLIADYKIYKDGNTYVQETTVPSSISNATLRESIMRLPASIAQEWEIEIETKYEVTEVCIAQSIEEIKIT